MGKCKICNKEGKNIVNICRPCLCVMKNAKILSAVKHNQDWFRDWQEIKSRKAKTEQRNKKLEELGI